MSEPPQQYGSSTLDDLMRITGDAATYELSNGQLLVAEPPPGWYHGAIAMTIGSALHAFSTRHRLGKVVTCDTWFVLRRSPDTVRGPDVAFVRHERCANLADPEAPFEGAPDLAVEILSPSDRPGRVTHKVRDYQQAGTTVIWLVNPRKRDIVVFDSAGRRRLTDCDTLSCPELLPGFSLSVASVFD